MIDERLITEAAVHDTRDPPAAARLRRCGQPSGLARARPSLPARRRGGHRPSGGRTAAARRPGPRSGGFIGSAIAHFTFFEFVVLNAHIAFPDGTDAGRAVCRLFMCELRQDGATGRLLDRLRPLPRPLRPRAGPMVVRRAPLPLSGPARGRARRVPPSHRPRRAGPGRLRGPAARSAISHRFMDLVLSEIGAGYHGEVRTAKSDFVSDTTTIWNSGA